MFKMKGKKFNYSLNFKTTDFRKQPELYRIGVGEQGVLLVEPYKSEILPYWKFKTEKIAKASARKIYQLFNQYLKAKDFVGADLARKYLQMGFTRARRYANHKSGKKYAEGKADKNKGLKYPYTSGSKNKGNKILKQETDALTSEKARAAEIFRVYWFKAKNKKAYLILKEKFRKSFEEMT